MKKMTAKKKTKKETKTKKTVKEVTAEQKTAPVAETTSMEKIKKGFSEGVEKGRRTLLKKLLQAKGTETWEIQKLYSKGMMEPELLEDLTLGDLVKASGIRMDFARIVKEVILRKDHDTPFEYEKNEIELLYKETNEIRLQTDEVRKEIEQLNKKRVSLDSEMDEMLEETNEQENELNKFKEMEKNCYFNEKRIQDDLMFVIKEQNVFKEEVDRYKNNYGYSEKELNTIKREFLFTKGECHHILEKINFLVNKLDKAIKVKGLSQTRLTSFLQELRSVHDTLMEANKKTSVEYYENKQ